MASQVRQVLRAAEDAASRGFGELAKRINIPLTATSPPGLVQADTVDPWTQAGKYGLGWTYFALVLTFLVVLMRVWHWWQDKIRQAIYKQEVEKHFETLYSMEPEWDRTAAAAALSTGGGDAARIPEQQFFPDEYKEETSFRPKTNFASVGFVNDSLALFRWVFYRSLPDVVLGRQRVTFSSLGVLACAFVALAFVALYCFLPQPLYWQSIQFGSPPLAIRAGMIAIAMTPWIFATSTKANLLSLITGIGPERLNVIHRWLGYLTLFLALVHMIPFYVQPVWEDGGMAVFSALFPPGSGIIYGSGIAAFVPLAWLCVFSLPLIRRKAYELFVSTHVPVGLVYVAVLFWHTKNFLMSWAYLESTLAIFVLCYAMRLFNLNWSKPWRRMSWLIGDEAAINIMTENVIKLTIPTQMRWKPGQYVYLRMPGISVLGNHPFTITSLCSEDFPSEYGEQYRDCVLVFRPYGGFTRKVLETAIEKGPFHTYRAFLDGPYGGMRRELAAFDTCILIAGGSGITSLMSQLLNLIKRMRDAKAITKRVVVVWSLKRIEAMEWFHEELRICREAAPPESVTCKFFVTSGAPDDDHPGAGLSSSRAPRPLSNLFHDRLDGFVSNIAQKRNSAFIQAEAQGDPDRERELRAEAEDRFTSLPQQKYLQPYPPPPPPPPPPHNMRMQAGGDDNNNNNNEAAYGPEVEGQDQREVKDARDSEHVEIKSSSGKEKEKQKEKENEKVDDDGQFHFPPIMHRAETAPHFNYALPAGKQRYSQFVEEETAAAPYQAEDGEATEQQQQQQQQYQQQQQHQQPIHPPELAHLRTTVNAPHPGFEFEFQEPPASEFQKSLMRPTAAADGGEAGTGGGAHQIDGGWSVEHGRPDLGAMLQEWATGGPDGRGILGRRTAVFVCGPPSMRVGVANTVARLQAEIWGDPMLEEIFLHTENYNL